MNNINTKIIIRCLLLVVLAGSTLSNTAMQKRESQKQWEFLFAARTNNSHEVRRLLAEGISNINVQDYSFGTTEGGNYSGLSALMWAAHRGNIDIVDLLLGAGARVDLKSLEGLTAAQIAIARGYPEIAKLIHDRTTPFTLREQSIRDLAKHIKNKKITLEKAKKMLPVDLHQELKNQLK